MVEALFVKLFVGLAGLFVLFLGVIAWLYFKQDSETEESYYEPQLAMRILDECRVWRKVVTDTLKSCADTIANCKNPKRAEAALINHRGRRGKI